MTRETKLGAIVAGTFLTLVGGVVAMKYMAKPPAPVAAVQEVAQALAPAQARPGVPETPPPEPAPRQSDAEPPQNHRAGGPATGVLPPRPQEATSTTKPGITDPALVIGNDIIAPPAPTISGEINVPTVRRVGHEAPMAAASPMPPAIEAVSITAPVVPPPADPIVVPGPANGSIVPPSDQPAKPLGGPQKEPIVIPGSIVAPPSDPPARPPVAEASAKKDLPPHPMKKEPVSAPGPEPLVLVAPDVNSSVLKDQPPAPIEKKEPMPMAPPAGAGNLIVPAPAPAGKDGFTSSPKKKDPTAAQAVPPPLDPGIPQIEVTRPEPKNPRTGGGEPKKESPPAIDVPVTPPGFDAPMPAPLPANPAIDAPGKIDLPANPPIPKKDSPRDPVVTTGTTKLDLPPARPPVIPPMGITPVEKKNPPATLDFDSSVPKGSAPAVISGSSTPGAAKQDAGYDEDLHSLQPSESYRSISKQYYNSEAYSTALQRYNRDHPGQADYVRIPPIWVLEKSYASDIAGTAAAAARSASSAPPPTAVITRTADTVYTVAENGEMLAEIARKTLGSKDAWQRIWDMNKQLNPAELVPGGTRLQLPDGSRSP